MQNDFLVNSYDQMVSPQPTAKGRSNMLLFFCALFVNNCAQPAAALRDPRFEAKSEDGAGGALPI